MSVEKLIDATDEEQVRHIESHPNRNASLARLLRAAMAYDPARPPREMAAALRNEAQALVLEAAEIERQYDESFEGARR